MRRYVRFADRLVDPRCAGHLGCARGRRVKRRGFAAQAAFSTAWRLSREFWHLTACPLTEAPGELARVAAGASRALAAQ
jgi:hypothetical protein